MQLKKRFENAVSELTEIYGLDVRSLALFRACLALILLVDIRIRLQDLRVFYADWGVMPRSFLLEHGSSPFKLSLYFMNGFGFFQGFLMAVAFVIALALLVGYRTRLATLLSWALLCSLHTRNPMILQGGDGLIRVSLFWSMFLPLGAAWSVDRALDSTGQKTPKKIFSGGTVALLAQVCMLYWFTAALKSGHEWVFDKTAVYYALNLDPFERPFGRFLLTLPSVLPTLTFAVLWFERLGPFLLLFPLRVNTVRMLGVCAFLLLHAGMGSALRLGPFPFIGATTAIAFLPSGFWDWILLRVWPRGAGGLIVHYDRDCGFCKKSVLLLRTFLLKPETPVLPAQNEPLIEKEMRERNSWVVRDAHGKDHYKFDAFLTLCSASPLAQPLAFFLSWAPFRYAGTRLYEAVARNRPAVSRMMPEFKPLRVKTPRWAHITALFFAGYVLVWNLSVMDYFKIPKPAKIPIWMLQLDQGWNMFAPSPDTSGGWHVFYVRLQNGEEVDLLRDGKPVDWQKPPDVSSLYKNERWRKYLSNISEFYNVEGRPLLAHYLCLERNRDQKDDARKVERVEIYYMREVSPPPGFTNPPPKKVLLWGEDCGKAF